MSLRAHGWPVFAAAVVPCAADSDGPGQLNHPISCGGVPVHPGDIILADDNGVAVIPHMGGVGAGGLKSGISPRPAAWRRSDRGS